MAKNNETKNLEMLLSESNIDAQLDAEINSILEELGTNDAPASVEPSDVEKPEAGEPGAGFAPDAVKTGETEVSPSKDTTLEDKEKEAADIGAQPVVEGCVKEDGSVLDQNPAEKAAEDHGVAEPGVAQVDEVSVIPSAVQDPIAPVAEPVVEPASAEINPFAGMDESFANIFNILSDNINEGDEETFKAGYEDYKDNGSEKISADQVETSTSNGDYFKDEKIGDDMNEKLALQEAKGPTKAKLEPQVTQLTTELDNLKQAAANNPDNKKLQNQINSLKAEIKAKTDEIKGHAATVDAKNKEIEGYKKNLGDKDVEIQNYQKTVDAQKNEIEGHKNAKEAAEKAAETEKANKEKAEAKFTSAKEKTEEADKSDEDEDKKISTAEKITHGAAGTAGTIVTVAGGSTVIKGIGEKSKVKAEINSEKKTAEDTANQAKEQAAQNRAKEEAEGKDLARSNFTAKTNRGTPAGDAIADYENDVATANADAENRYNAAVSNADKALQDQKTVIDASHKGELASANKTIAGGAALGALGALTTGATIAANVIKRKANKKKGENKQARQDAFNEAEVTERVSMMIANENNDRLFVELVEATALANRLRNAICEKYHDIASERAVSLMEEIKVWSAACEDSVEEPDAYLFESKEMTLEEMVEILEANDVEVSEENLVEFAEGLESGKYVLEEAEAGEAATPVRVAKTASENNYYTTDFSEKGDVKLDDAHDNDAQDGEQKADYDVHCHGDVDMKDGGVNVPDEGNVDATEADWFDNKELTDVKEVIVESAEFDEAVREVLDENDYMTSDENIALIKESYLNGTLSELDETLTEGALIGKAHAKKAAKLAVEINNDRAKAKDTTDKVRKLDHCVKKANANGVALTYTDVDGRVSLSVI